MMMKSLGLDLWDRIHSFISLLAGPFQHRVRAALTLLGITIGTGSIILLASLIQGGESYLVHASQEAEDNDIIEAYEHEPKAEDKNKTTRSLTRTDAKEVAEAIPNAMVSPEASFDTYAYYQQRRKRVAIVSTNDSTLKLYRLQIGVGRALDDFDRAKNSRVCVIGHEIHDELLRSAPLSSGSDSTSSNSNLHIEVDGRVFTVVGVLAKKPMIGNTDSTYMWDRKVLIPETTYDGLYSTSHHVDRIYVRGVSTPSTKKMARTTTTGVLLRRHLGVMNFELSKDQSGGTEALIFTVIHILLIGTGGLALLASGINIMNVMLVTVSERKREIGLRRAIGAPPRAILVQFLLEAVTLSLVGAIVGVVVGVILSWATAMLARSGIGYWELTIPAWSLALGLGLALATGAFFGLLPAWRASKVSPIDALRAD